MQAKLDIEAKKAELEQARIIRQHNEEYEVTCWFTKSGVRHQAPVQLHILWLYSEHAVCSELLLQVLRHLLVQHPSRAVTQKEIDRVNRAIEKITAEGKKIAAIMQVTMLSRAGVMCSARVADMVQVNARCFNTSTFLGLLLM
jgi:glycogen synthase